MNNFALLFRESELFLQFSNLSLKCLLGIGDRSRIAVGQYLRGSHRRSLRIERLPILRLACLQILLLPLTKLVFYVLTSLFEFVQALPQSASKLGKLLGSEQQQDRHENEDHVRTGEIREKREWHHKGT